MSELTGGTAVHYLPVAVGELGTQAAVHDVSTVVAVHNVPDTVTVAVGRG